MNHSALLLFVSAVLVPLTMGLSGSASAGYGNLIRLNIKNGDNIPTTLTIIPDYCSNLTLPAAVPGLTFGQVRLEPLQTIVLDFTHDPSGSCDGASGYFAIRVEYNKLTTSFIYSEGGPLSVRTDLPPPQYAFKTFSRLGNGPQGAGEYLWETSPTPKNLAKPVGSWLLVCQPVCSTKYTEEITHGMEETKAQSVETTKAISVSLDAGMELKGFSANANVTASATETLAHSLSQSISSGSLSSSEITFPGFVLASDIFAIWRWVVDATIADGNTYRYKTNKFTCTTTGASPDYLPGSDQNVAACRAVGVTPTPTPTPGTGIVPQAGLWSDPTQDGTGYALDYRHGVLVVAMYSYQPNAVAQWYLAAAAMNGNTFTATLDKYVGGQCFSCAFSGSPSRAGNDGTITIEFSSATSATLRLPGGRVAHITPFVF